MGVITLIIFGWNSGGAGGGQRKGERERGGSKPTPSE